MVKLLQWHLTVSCITQMHVDGGAKCYNFCYKNLLYVLFVRKTSVNVAGG